MKVHSRVAKPLWNPSELISLDAKEVIFAAPPPGTKAPLKRAGHALATVSFAAPGGHAGPGEHVGIDPPGNIVTVEHEGNVGRVIIGDLLVMRNSTSLLWLELAAIRAEFTQLVVVHPYGGGGTHDDGAHGGGT